MRESGVSKLIFCIVWLLSIIQFNLCKIKEERFRVFPKILNLMLSPVSRSFITFDNEKQLRRCLVLSLIRVL